MSLRPLSDLGPASWVSSAEAFWYDVVNYCPPGFEAYLRLVVPRATRTRSCSAHRARY
ncbi:hypothetical protein [Mumia sp. Pv 4-285]|uniref:hypothetical protein n=1 Tax=Mumia qirimensis TaxID=3234852 RepID=UPI00351D8D08